MLRKARILKEDQESKSPEVQEFRSPEVQESRSPGVQKPAFRCISIRFIKNIELLNESTLDFIPKY